MTTLQRSRRVVSDSDTVKLQPKVLACFNEISGWCESNKLMLNHSKTNPDDIFNKCIQSNNFSFNFEEFPLSRSKSTIFLGIIIDKHMDWSGHIDDI